MANKQIIADHNRTTQESRRLGWLDVAARVRAMNLNPGFVYFIGYAGGPVKIGYSRKPETRLRYMQTFSPYKLELLAKSPGSPADERTYHHCFRGHRLEGEWFTPHADILAEIDRLSTPHNDVEIEYG